MKRRIILITTLLLSIATLTGCGGLEPDYSHAYAEITSPCGIATIAQSYNSINKSNTGLLLAGQYCKNFSVPSDEDIVTVHFVCDSCGHDETEELVAPSAKVFSCKCKEPFEAKEKDEDSENILNKREYVSVKVFIAELVEEE